MTGSVVATPWAEIAKAKIKGTDGERPLLLDEVIDVFEPTAIDLRLEIKPDVDGVPYPGLEAEIAKALLRRQMLPRTLISAFNVDTLARFRDIAAPKDLPLACQPADIPSDRRNRVCAGDSTALRYSRDCAANSGHEVKAWLRRGRRRASESALTR